MPTKTLDSNSTVIRNVIDRLQKPIPDLSTLLTLLSGPLDGLGLLPPQFTPYNREPLPGSVDVSNHIPSLQRILLNCIAPTWDTLLQEENTLILLDQYFCPNGPSFTSPTAGDVVLLAYASILSQPLTRYGIDLLAKISTEYPVDRLHAVLFARDDRDQLPKGMLRWEDYVRNIMMVPAKVANAVAGKGDIPPLLEHGSYFNNLCLRCENLVSSLSKKHCKGASLLG
jgi:telomere length regulation protein